MTIVLNTDHPTVAPTEDPPAQARPKSGGSFWRWAWLVLLVVPLPMLVPYLAGLWQLEHYQYVPFVFLAVGYLAYSRSDYVFYKPRRWLGWALIACGLGSTIVAIALFSPWFAAVGFVLLATSCLYSLRGVEDRTLALLALPLAMLIRVPLNLDELLIIRLQIWTTRFASLLLDLVGIAHTATGNVIGLVSRDLFVAEACSGIQSVFTLLFLATLIIAYKRHPFWFTPFYAVAAVLMAVLGNSLRVAIVAAADAWLGVDWTAGWSHELVGYVTLIIAAATLLSFDQFMLAAFHPIKINDLDPRRDPLVDRWNRLVVGGGAAEQMLRADSGFDEAEQDHSNARRRRGARIKRTMTTAKVSSGTAATLRACLVSLSVSLVLLSAYQVSRNWAGVEPEREPTTAYFVPPENLLNGALGAVQVVGYEVARDSDNPRLGKAADIWTVSDGRMRSQIVLSQPYFGWHELCFCYENLGWQLVDRSIVAGQSPAQPQTSVESTSSDHVGYAVARFRRDNERFGYLLFSAITYEGAVAEPPVGIGSTAGAGARLVERLTRGESSTDEMMMLQLWIESPEALQIEDLQLLKKSFLQTRSRIVAAVQDSHRVPMMTASR
jgi:exosortase